ncbi:unnamed protein product [Rotaria magnacalcarata]|uniref:Ubiquitin carboxyl-terminal hydrolase n=3 Tax=Rotaria magnacalcarata TaxID=392030 RepID=A0A815UCZ1_9BILA|nr:unnamed protein product [Rotaria magnacalcarata]
MDRMIGSYETDHNNRFYRASTFDTSRSVFLELNCTDRNEVIKIKNPIKFSSKDTIHYIKYELMRIIYMESIDPEQVILAEIQYHNIRYIMNPVDENMTLDGLNVKNESTLCFKQLAVSSYAKLSQVTVSFVSMGRSEVFKLDEYSTTVDALLDRVIIAFDLNLIERQRIQLRSYRDNVLNASSNLGKKLSELGIRNYSIIFLYIVKPTSTITNDDDIYVYMKSNTIDGVDLLLASPTDAIGELEARIKSKYQWMVSVAFRDTDHNAIDASDCNRKLSELGIKSSQTIYADIEEVLPFKQTDESQPSSSSTTMNSNTVDVRCQLSGIEPIMIKALVTDTVAELTANIGALRKNQTMAQFVLWSGSITIDDKQPDKRLADFGIKPGTTIVASVIEILPTNNFIKTSEIDKTYTTTKTSDLDVTPKGLDNLGNTCFMNSALQCLIHVPALTEYFMNKLSQEHTTDQHLDNYNPFHEFGEVTEAYAKLTWNLQKPDRKSYLYYDYSFRPTHFKETIGRLEPRFATFDQQDAQEFLTFLLNAIHQEIKQKSTHAQNTIITELFFCEIQSSTTCCRCQHVNTRVESYSILPLPLNSQERMFQVNYIRLNGQEGYDTIPMSIGHRIEHLVYAFFERRHDTRNFSYVRAMAKNATETAIDFGTSLRKLPEQALTLIEQVNYNGRIAPFQYDNELTSLKLDQCLQEFVSLETPDDPWFCDQHKCKRDSKVSKQLQILTFPPVLIIQLKRFSHENGLRRKLDTLVDYPIDGFNLGRLLKSSEEAVYDLIAVCNHIGSISGGHYTAYARKGPNKERWYKLDDSYVSTLYYKEELISKNAYLLVYLKRPKQT